MSKCYCFEKYEDKLPEGINVICFKEACKNYRENKEKERKNGDCKSP